ncbi:hypothetical protein SJAV_09100 [Sulfurisphaera javensis]|uniref:Sulfocyanin n=1 Tax=Sulfurisphaera javensis TaxID=2049879 RepID=A0AAT9GQQ3_9CREN
MERQSLLVSLLVVTLIVNVVLGIELYYTLHKPSQPSGSVPLNISQLQILTNTTTTITQTATKTVTVTSNSSQTTSQSKLYSFSFKVKFKIHVNEKGVYIIGIKPNITFNSLYVLLYFEDGKSVSLSLNNTYSNITLKDNEVEVTAYIFGSTYENLTPSQIFEDLGLYLHFVSPLSSESDDLILLANYYRINPLCEDFMCYA